MKLASIEDEFKKNSELKHDELTKLIEWVKQQPHLPNISELEGSLFLHSCFYSTELAKQAVDTYFTMRTHIPEFFSGLNLNRDELQQTMNTITIIPIEKTTPKGDKIFIGRLANSDPSKFNFTSILKLVGMIFDITLQEIGTVPGYIIILDQTGISLGHVARLGPFTMKKFLYYLQDAIPLRITGLHFINIDPISDKILALMRPFLKKELSDVLYLHKNAEPLKNFIPLEILPKEYGGMDNSGDELSKKLYEYCTENTEFYANLENRKVNENIRPGKPKDASDLFGIEGNFKKLDID